MSHEAKPTSPATNRLTVTRRLGMLAAVMALVVAACGGSSDAETGTSSTTATPGVESPTDGTSNDADGDTGTSGDDGTQGIVEQAEQLLDEFSGDGGAATITIGDETWEFTFYDSVPIASCNADFFGGFLAVLTSGDDIMVPFDQVMITLPGGDFKDPPEIHLNLKVSDDAEWIADETIYENNPDLPPGIGVTSFTIDGQGASGTATFYQEESYFQANAGTGDLVMMDGTFEVVCAAG